MILIIPKIMNNSKCPVPKDQQPTNQFLELSNSKVFSWAKKQNIPVVYASSSAVYGDLPLGNDMEEKFDILSPYAQDKLMLEHYAKMFWNIYNVPSIGLRFFNVYGPRQDATSQYSGVISIFIDRLLQPYHITS